MKSKKEQKTKNQSKNGKKTIAAAKTGKSDAEANRTIKQVVIETITANSVVSNDEMIAAVKAEFPKSAFNDKHAAWYRSQARKGLLTGSPIVIPALSRKHSKAAE
jgi:transcriptional/translational regulatory protein YebC/TACO1